MAKSDLEVEERAVQGSSASNRLRRDGWVPGNVYGLERPPFQVKLRPQAIDNVLRMKSGQNTVLTLKIPTRDVSREVIIRDLQRDPVTDRVIHVDFLRIDPTQALEIQVPIELVGTPVGVRTEGGILDVIAREATVLCLPRDIPDGLKVDIEELHLNQHLSLSDLEMPPGVELMDDPSATVVVVEAPKAIEEETPEEDEEAAEADEAAEETAETPSEDS